jgi:hypothetical protein
MTGKRVLKLLTKIMTILVKHFVHDNWKSKYKNSIATYLLKKLLFRPSEVEIGTH